jgi:hypothetical protein
MEWVVFQYFGHFFTPIQKIDLDFGLLSNLKHISFYDLALVNFPIEILSAPNLEKFYYFNDDGRDF